VPSMVPGLKRKWTGLLGKNGYKLSFTALLLIALALIITGWRSTVPELLYSLAVPFRHGAMLLVLLAFVLFGASQYPSRIKQFVRHPQLTGVIVWAAAHLLVNGDSRSVVLFGSMAVWASLEIVLINRREGAWVKTPVPGWGRELRGLIISLVIFVLVVLAHPYFTGVAVA